MVRFLTPSKIGLLALIELYTDTPLPKHAMMPILTFILSHVLPFTASQGILGDKNSAETHRLLPPLRSFEALLAGHDSASNQSNLGLWTLFLQRIWSINSLDALHVFFERQSSLFAKTKLKSDRDIEMGISPPQKDSLLIARTSPFGIFLRNAIVEFEKLRFSDVVALWTALVAWRCESSDPGTNQSASTGQGGNAGGRILTEVERLGGTQEARELQLVMYGDLKETLSREETVSIYDLEKVLEFQVQQMQKLGSRLPSEIKDSLKTLLDERVLTPSLSHYLIFLDSWRAGDYTTSFNNLHRYFDYTMQNKDRLLYQYALMNLSVLQADFGCFDEAVAAMLETIATARENKDMACLNFALNWLYHFGKAHPNIVIGIESTNMLNVERDGLPFLRLRAKEAGMWTLWSSSLLSEAKLALSNGESVSGTFEKIFRSSHLIMEKNLKSMIGSQMAMHSSLWTRLGATQLAKQYCDVFLSCYTRFGSFEDTLRFTCRVSYLLAEKGRCDEALGRLEVLDESSLRSWKSNQYWMKYHGILRLKRSLRMQNLNGAEKLLFHLLQCIDPTADHDLALEINILHVDYLLERTDFFGALNKIEALSSRMKDTGDDINLRLRLLLMKATVQNRVGRPQRGLSVAVRAASIAWRAHILPTLWAAMGAIANILTSLSEFQASHSILVSVIPRALECQDYALNAQLYSFLADAHMGLAGQAKAIEYERAKNLTAALKYIDRAFNALSANEDLRGQCDMMEKKVMVLQVMGDEVKANDCASLYLELAGRVESARS